MHKLSAIIFGLVLCFAPLTLLSGKKHDDLVWPGRSLKKYSTQLTCAKAGSSSEVTSCKLNGDSVIWDQFAVMGGEARIYQGKVIQVSYDIDRETLPYLVSFLTMEYGRPQVLESGNDSLLRHDNFTSYTWSVQGVKLRIIDKGVAWPIWLNLDHLKLLSRAHATSPVDPFEKYLGL